MKLCVAASFLDSRSIGGDLAQEWLEVLRLAEGRQDLVEQLAAAVVLVSINEAASDLRFSRSEAVQLVGLTGFEPATP